MAVTHCICTGLSFAQVLAWARTHNATTIEEAGQALGCSTHCGLCGQYLRYALATGVVNVPYPCPNLPEVRPS